MAAAKKKRSWEVWRDAGGGLSALRIGTLAFLLVPVAIAVHDYFTVGFGPRPINDVIHRTGYWALLFLLISLAVTPFRRIGRFGKLLDVRRMIGVGAFVYAAVHIVLYMADQKWNLWKVASEIVLRLYLTIGFMALTGLAVLAITSTDGMVRRLGGKRWQRLHQVVYVLSLLALIHFFQQTKADVWLPTFIAGLFGWMMAYRILIWRKTERGELSSLTLAGPRLRGRRADLCRGGGRHRHCVQRVAVAGVGDGVRLRPVLDPAGLDCARRRIDRGGGRLVPRPVRQTAPCANQTCAGQARPGQACAGGRQTQHGAGVEGSRLDQPIWDGRGSCKVIPLSHSFRYIFTGRPPTDAPGLLFREETS